jgi:serine protease
MKRATTLMLILMIAGLSAVGVAQGARTPQSAPPTHHPLTHRPRAYAPPRTNTAPIEEERGASTANTFSTDYMLYRGGPVQITPRIYVVFWGNWSTANDSVNVAGQLYWFLKGVGGSAFNKTQTFYGQSCTVNTYSCPSTASYIQNSANQLKGYWYDSSPVPTTPTQTDVQAEALRAASHFGDYGVNTQYFVALPKGHDDASFPTNGGRTCAYHAYTLTPSGTTTIQYTSLSYMPDAGTNCGNYTVNNSILDGVTIVASHEYSETETDPWVGAGDGYEGWDDSTRNFGEDGDKCAGGATYNKNFTFTTGTFPIQSEWSNYDRYYSGSGCRFWQ